MVPALDVAKYIPRVPAARVKPRSRCVVLRPPPPLTREGEWMDRQQYFERVMSDNRIGQRLDLKSLHPAAARILESRADRARSFLATAAAKYPTMPPVYFDFVRHS